MTYVLPAALPQELLARGLDTASKYVWQLHRGIAFHADGRGYLHSHVSFRVGLDLDIAETRAEVVTMLDRNFSITHQVTLEDLHAELSRDSHDIQRLAVTHHDEVIFATSKNRTLVYDPTLTKRLASYPDGASGIADHAIAHGDELAIVAELPRFAAGLPSLTPTIASMRVLSEREPSRISIGAIEQLGPDRTLVACLEPRMRAFRYVVVARNGSYVAHLPTEMPYGRFGDFSTSYAAHEPLDSWLTRSDTALHVFDRDGKRSHRVPLGDDHCKAVVPMTLLGIGPRGELIWLHPKHRVIVVSDPVSSLRELEHALGDIDAVYAAELARLKKAVPHRDGWWCSFEPTTPRALAGKPKKKRDAPTTLPPPALVAKTPQQAMAQAPRDLDTIAVYADSIAATEPELSEYINVGVEVERAPTPELRARKDELWRKHGKHWLKKWNSPTALFQARFRGLAGLPDSIRFDEEIPRDLEAFERQVVQFPISTLSTYKIGQRGLASLASAPLLRRIESLYISATSKVKLGKQTLAWLQSLQLANLTTLSLSGVEVTPSGIRAVVDSLPALRELRMFDTFLDVDGIRAIAQSPVAANLEKLDLSYNSITSAAMTAFASFPKLRELGLRRNAIDDEVCESAPRHLPVTTLDIDDNTRLGAKGLAWLVAAMPELTAITLARQMKVPTIRALAPIARQLERVHGSWMALESKRELIAMLGPNLQELTFSSDCQNLDLAKLTSLRKLELGDISDADVRALTHLPFATLEYLEICSEITDDHALQFRDATNLPALKKLYIRSRALTTKGLGALLEMSQLTELKIMYAKLKGAGQLTPREPPFVLELSHHNLTSLEADTLRAVWGDRVLLL